MDNNFDYTLNLNKTNKELIKDNELKKLIQFKLDKIEFDQADLININDIILNGKKNNGDINIIDFNDINLFPNLKKIEFKNISISKEQLKIIEGLDEIYFQNCKIESIENIEQIKKISFNNCLIGNFNIIENFKNLEELELINMKLYNFDFLKELKILRLLKIKNINEFSLDKIDFILPIKYFSIDGIDNLKEDYLTKNYPNLETLSIPMDKQDDWSEELEKIEQNGIKILINDIYEY